MTDIAPTSFRPGRERIAASRAIDAAFTPIEGGLDADGLVRRYAREQYENFSVVSLFVPRAIRQDFYNLYAFCRTADDLGDELGDRAASLHHLNALREGLIACYDGRPVGAVFTALLGTIRRHDIPIEPFLDLISAFEQDQSVSRYETFEQLHDYCRRSADPVGRLVLYVCGYRDAERQRLSDHTCTALQLANFWQDISRDLHGLDRVYVPAEWMNTFGVTVEQLRGTTADDKVRAMIRFAVGRTEEMFSMGDALLPTLSRPVAAHVALFIAGGRATLDAIRAQDFDTLSRRPTVSKWTKARLIARAFAARAKTIGFRRPA